MPRVAREDRSRLRAVRSLAWVLALLLAPTALHGQAAPGPDTTIAGLVSRLGSFHGSVREGAVAALAAKGAPAVPYLRTALATRDPRAAFGAAYALADMGEVGVRALVDALRDSIAGDAAGEVLRGLETESVSVARLLEPLLTDSSAAIRAVAVGALNTDGPHAQDPAERAKLVTVLRRAMTDPDPRVREAAADRLEVGRGVAGELQPELIRAARDSSADVRASAVFALGRAARAAPDAIEVLEERMASDPDTTVRWRAARALGWLGPQASAAVPALVRALGDPLPDLRGDAAEALGMVGLRQVPDTIVARAMAGLRTALHDSVRYVASWAVQSLARLGPPGIPGLIEALGSPRDTLAAKAARELGHLPPIPMTTTALLDALRDRRSLVRDEVADALGGFGPPVLPTLRPHLRSTDPNLRAGANRAVRYVERAGRVPVGGRCYELRRGAWSAGPEIGGDSVFTTAPRYVRFTFVKDRAPVDSAAPAMEVVSARGLAETVMGPGAWVPIRGRRAISVVYSNGFSGVVMKLELRGEELVGEARTFWDFGRAPQAAPIHGRPVPCEWPSGSVPTR